MSGLSTYQEEQIRELVNRDKKIAAVKLYREITGASLREAAEAVEAIGVGWPTKFPEPVQDNEPDTVLKSRIMNLLAERKKIEAVKLYRETYNCGLKEAKDAVERIQTEMRKEGYSNIPSAPAISDDPFARDGMETRRGLIILAVIFLIALGALAFLFILR